MNTLATCASHPGVCCLQGAEAQDRSTMGTGDFASALEKADCAILRKAHQEEGELAKERAKTRTARE